MTRLAVSDPSKVVLAGLGEMTLNCGSRTSTARAGGVPDEDGRPCRGVAGEAALIEFTP